MLEIVFYTRPGCRLCREALRQLAAAVPDATVREVDVDSDPDLRSRYGFDIPVAVADGRELFRHRFDPRCVEAVQRGAAKQ